jgi:hypothetical protein
MAMSVIDGDLYVRGTVTAGGLNPPNGSVTDAAVQSGAGVQASKLQHQHQPVCVLCDHATNAAPIRKVAHVVRGATATLEEALVGATVAATGNATITTTIKVNGTTIISGGGTMDLDSATVAMGSAPYSAFTTTDLVRGDVVEVEITAVNAGTGTLPKGVYVAFKIREDAD